MFIGITLIIFRARLAALAVRWNAKWFGMRLDTQLMQFTYIIGGLIGIIAGVFLIFGGY